MKSSKYTQASGPNDNDYSAGFADTSARIIDDSNNFNTTSKDHLVAYRPQNANKQDFEMVCNCALKEIVYYPRSRLKQHCSEQDIALANRFEIDSCISQLLFLVCNTKGCASKEVDVSLESRSWWVTTKEKVLSSGLGSIQKQPTPAKWL